MAEVLLGLMGEVRGKGGVCVPSLGQQSITRAVLGHLGTREAEEALERTPGLLQCARPVELDVPMEKTQKQASLASQGPVPGKGGMNSQMGESQ